MDFEAIRAEFSNIYAYANIFFIKLFSDKVHVRCKEAAELITQLQVSLLSSPFSFEGFTQDECTNLYWDYSDFLFIFGIFT